MSLTTGVWTRRPHEACSPTDWLVCGRPPRAAVMALMMSTLQMRRAAMLCFNGQCTREKEKGQEKTWSVGEMFPKNKECGTIVNGISTEIFGHR